MLFQRLTQDILRLGHGAFVGVYQQQHTINHGQHAFHFSAEIRMAGRVQNIDLGAIVHHCRIFRQNGDTAFPFQIVRIHHAFRHLFIGAENMALLQHSIYQCGFAMIDMGDDRNIANIISNHYNCFLSCIPYTKTKRMRMLIRAPPLSLKYYIPFIFYCQQESVQMLPSISSI